jgi:hypothetical protein
LRCPPLIGLEANAGQTGEPDDLPLPEKKRLNKFCLREEKTQLDVTSAVSVKSTLYVNIGHIAVST